MDELREGLRSLVARYQANRNEYLNQGYGETSLRVEFLDPLFTILGWDVDNRSGRSIYGREVIHEASVTVDDEDSAHANKKPDYAFRIGGETKFFLEAKRPGVNISESRGPAFQARRYGWNGSLAIAVLSNFEDLSVYDCSYRPVPTQGAGFARIVHYHYDEYVDHFDDLYALLSKQAVINGSLQRVDAGERVAKVPFDDLFLDQISSWRADIALDVYRHYAVTSMDELNSFTQTLLNRIIFLRVCEDRSFEETEELLHIGSYRQLRKVFEAADKKYDSGLFDYLDDARWKVSDALLVGIFQDLYYPNSSYDFNVVQPHVIGHIYERFLSQRISIVDGEVRLDALPEAVESNGVVPTPKEITDAIVTSTLQNVAFPCKVADICCGSGNFLLSAYELLVSKELTRVLEEKDGDIELIQRESGPDLPYWRKRQILLEAVYGVDINPLAVEVAQLSLSLRLLQGCSGEELETYRATTGNSLLPNLSDNIKCGNSVVDYQYFGYDPSAIDDIGTLRAVRPFDWASEFPFGGFDAIVGNPPYVRVQNLARYIPKEYGYYRSGSCDLRMATIPALDKYQLFVERGLGLLKERGRLGMIIPNKFMTIKTGQPLRDLLTSQYHVTRIVDFGALQVFQGRSTYTCIVVATPEDVSTFSRQLVSSLPDYVEDPLHGGLTYPSSMLTKETWSFPPEAITRQLEVIGPKCTKLGDFAEVFVGLQTSRDSAYIIKPIGQTDQLYYFEDENGQRAAVEKALCHPCLLDVTLEAYATPIPNRQIIFPYRFVGGKAKLIESAELEQSFPYAHAYFVSIKAELDRRAVSPRRRGNDWYKYGRSQSLNRFSGKPHLVWPVLSLGPRYALDRSGTVMFTGGGNGPYYGLELKDGTPEAIEYVQAALSYWFVEQLVWYRTSKFRGDFYSHGKQFVEGLPIRRIDFGDASDVALHDKVVSLVRTINELMGRCQEANDREDTKLYARSIEACERSLRETMDEIYMVRPGLADAVER